VGAQGRVPRPGQAGTNRLTPARRGRPTARPRLLAYLKRNGLLERFLEAERGGKRAEV